MLKLLRRSGASEAGFTLMELLVVVLIVGVLAAVAVPLYLGYVRDARLAEGKALGGNALTAAQRWMTRRSCSRTIFGNTRRRPKSLSIRTTRYACT